MPAADRTGKNKSNTNVNRPLEKKNKEASQVEEYGPLAW